MRWLLWNDQYIKSSSNIFWSFGGFVWLLLLQGSVHKWRHPHIGGRVSANRWRYTISLFSILGVKGEGGDKNLKKWVTSFMDGPLVIMIMPFLFSGVIRYLSCVITFFKKKTTYITLHYQSTVWWCYPKQVFWFEW